MKLIPLSLFLGLTLGLPPGPVRGEATLPPAPPVEDLVLEALSRAPAIAVKKARVDAAREMEEPAGALPDPMLELMIQDAGFPDWTVGEMEMSMIGPQLSQGLPFPGKQGARKAAAAAATRVRREEMESLRRGVALEVRRLYAEVYAFDREAELLDVSRDMVELLAVTVSHHIEAGDMDQEAALKARLLTSRIEERRTNLHAERTQTVAMLNRILDRPAGADLGVVTELPIPVPPPPDLDSLAEASFAEVIVRNAGVIAAEKSLRATRLDLRPDFMLGAGVGFRGNLDPVVNLRFGIELPLWQGKKQRPMIRAARAELDMAREELRDARATARAEALRLRAEWIRTEEQVRRYEESFVPQTSLAFDAARSAYLGQRGDFSTVIEDFNMWIEARTGLAEREAERFMAWAGLDALLHPAPDVAPASIEGETR
jgi:outer membrane protein TolC